MTDKNYNYDTTALSHVLKTISTQDFLDLGVHHVAYVRPVVVQGRRAYAIHAADGTPLSVMESFNSAIIAVKQNDLEPATLH